MQETSTSQATILQFRQDIEAEFRREIREVLGVALREELAAPLPLVIDGARLFLTLRPRLSGAEDYGY